MDWLLALYTVGDHRVSMKNELSTLGNLNYIFPNPKPQTPNAQDSPHYYSQELIISILSIDFML